MTTMTLIPITDVAKRLGIVAEDIKRGHYGVTVHHTWDGRPAVSEADASRLREELIENREANRARKREEAEQKIRDAETFENEKERQFWTAYAAVAEFGGVYGPSNAAAVAYSVITSDDPENELSRVITRYGQPTERAIMYVMGRAKETSHTSKQKGRPAWLR